MHGVIAKRIIFQFCTHGDEIAHVGAGNFVAACAGFLRFLAMRASVESSVLPVAVTLSAAALNDSMENRASEITVVMVSYLYPVFEGSKNKGVRYDTMERRIKTSAW
ncbi:hypothetical protein AK51_11430 [Serratia nematodiphila DZ0503SBS1]|nr:hypothetical protein AK51_11430 [Serratia nematodiphila DZ0503SBS1]